MIRTSLKSFVMEYADFGTLQAQIPSTLYSTLCDHGILPSVNYGDPSAAIAALPAAPVRFSCNLPLDERILACKRAALCFFGIDAPAVVRLDDEVIGEIDEGGRSYIFDIGDALKRGRRHLCIAFPYDTKPRSITVPIPKWRDHGIYDRVELIAYDDAFIEGVIVDQKHENDNVSLHISAKIHGDIQDMKVIASLSSPCGKMYYCGLNRGKGSILISEPEYWWPHTIGKPLLYRLTLTVYRNGEPYDTKTYSVGLRDLAFVEQNENGDRSFALSVNGATPFINGAQYRPEHLLLGARTTEQTEKYLSALMRANVNYLVVSEGAPYLTDDFFALCDRLGILVEVSIPDDAPYIGGREEVYLDDLGHVMERIGYHPSLALLRSDLDETTSLREIPELLSRLAPAVLYRNLHAAAECAIEAFDTTSAFAPVRATPSFPVMRSLAQFLPIEQHNPYSLGAEQRCSDSIPDVFHQAADQYLFPVSMRQAVYLTQLYQADQLRRQIEFLRLRRDRAMGAVVCEANDFWGAVTPSVVDFYGRPKVALYVLEQLYAPVALLCRRDGYRVRLSVANETRNSVHGTIAYRLINMQNEVLAEGTYPFDAQQTSLTEIASVDFSTLVHKRENAVALVCSMAAEGRCVSRETVVYFAPKKHLALVDPHIEVSVAGGGKDYEITLTPHAFAPSVMLSIDGCDAVFSQNAIDLTKNAACRVTVRIEQEGMSVDAVRRALRVMSVYSIGRMDTAVEDSFLPIADKK